MVTHQRVEDGQAEVDTEGQRLLEIAQDVFQVVQVGQESKF
jgi:hypothetical protein